MNDINVENHGSLILFRPQTEAGKAWLAENTPPGDEVQYMGEALVVEVNYARNIVEGMRSDGLEVS